MALTKITPQMFDTSATAHDLNVDNGTFVVDGSASRVGIGTATPSTLLDVNGTATATTFVGALTGNVTGNVSGTAATVTGAAQTNITSVGTLTGLTLSGALVGTKASFDTASTTDYALRLTDNGVADYDVIFPDTSTYQLTTNTTSNKTFKLLNSGSGVFNLDVEGTITGTLATAAQTNITSVGTLTGLTMSGTLNISASTSTHGLSFGAYLPSAGQTILTYHDGNTRSGLGIVSGVHRMFTNNGASLSFGQVSTSDGSTYTERMRIHSSGNVGIGTSLFPATYDKLAVAGGIHIQDDNNAKLEIGRYSSSASNSYIKLGANSNSLKITNKDDNADIFTLTNTGQLTVGQTTSSTATATPVSLTLGATYSNAAGQNPKLKLWESGTDFIGLSVSSNQLDYIVTESNYNHVFYGGASGTTELARITGDGKVGIGWPGTSAWLGILKSGSSTPGMNITDGSTSDFQVYAGYATGIARVGPSAGGLVLQAANSEAMYIEDIGHVRFGSTGTPGVSNWGHSTYGNTEVNINGGGGYGVLHIQGDGAGSTNRIYSIGVGDEIMYLGYDVTRSAHNIKIYSNGTIETLGNIKPAAGYGIDFSNHASTTATGTAQQASVLDDYEEGTWTPFFFGTGTGTGVPLGNTQQQGSYIKIGNLVHLSFYVGVSNNNNSATGNIRLGGIPYNATNSYGTNKAIVTGSIMVDNLSLASGRSWVVPYMQHGATSIAFYQSGHSVGWNETAIDTSFTVIGEVTYRVD